MNRFPELIQIPAYNGKILILLFMSRGTSGIDVDLRRVDIDQCPPKRIIGITAPLNIFAGTDKCKQQTTEVSKYPV